MYLVVPWREPVEAWLRTEAGEISASVSRPDSRTPAGEGTAAILFDLAARDSGQCLPPCGEEGNGRAAA